MHTFSSQSLNAPLMVGETLGRSHGIYIHRNNDVTQKNGNFRSVYNI